jgi:hypothetical protein
MPPHPNPSPNGSDGANAPHLNPSNGEQVIMRNAPNPNPLPNGEEQAGA